MTTTLDYKTRLERAVLEFLELLHDLSLLQLLKFHTPLLQIHPVQQVPMARRARERSLRDVILLEV